MSNRVRIPVIVFLTVLSVSVLFTISETQGTRSTPYSSPSLLRGSSGQGQSLPQSNPLRVPGTSGPRSSDGSDSVVLSSGMFQGLLPNIPNLQFGYLYSFSNSCSTGRFTGDYLKPFSLNRELFVFGEVHVEGWNFLSSTGPSDSSGSNVNNRVDVSLGGGFRKFFGDNVLIGVNGFYDTTRLTGQWFASGGLGCEAAWLLADSDALDTNFNWYGKMLNKYEWINAFRYGPSNYDFEVGYSHEVWNGGPDLRLKIRGYHFDVGSNLRGWNGGAELKSRDGMFVLKYEAGYDRVDKTYQTVGAYVNVGFQIEDVLKGESPFTTPTPIFRSPRNLKHMLTQTVKRDWHQPTAVVVTRPGQGGGCDNLDRFLGSVLMSTEPPTGYTSGTVPFSSVPNTCLDPGAIITVEFDYAFDVTPVLNPTLVVKVGNASLSIELDRYTSMYYGQSGHMVANLFRWDPVTGYFLGQSVFTTSGTDPEALYIFVNDYGQASTLTITNVVIRFNQKSPL